MNITIIGTGYVGLVSGVCFAEIGHKVFCVDKNKDKIVKLNNNISPIFEKGLEDLIEKNKRKIIFTTKLSESIPNSDVIFLAVGTPSKIDQNGNLTGEVDLSYIYQAVEEISEFLKDGSVIVTKSTVPVGTNFKIKEIIKTKKPGLKFNIASNPEFLREGSAIKDFLNPDRILIGTENKETEKILEEVYSPLIKKGFLFLAINITSSELSKYAANTFLATKIAFINEIADICEKTGADIEEVSNAIGLDKRIGKKHLKAGPGFGGSCFPKDIAALKYAADSKVTTMLTNAVIDSNNIRQKKIADRIKNMLSGDIKNKIITVFGLAFKAGTDDVRESPAIKICKHLLESSIKIRAYDPEAKQNAKKFLKGDIEFFNEPIKAIKNSNLLVILTEWPEFKHLNYQKLGQEMKEKKIFDTRNLLHKKSLDGFHYDRIGNSLLT